MQLQLRFWSQTERAYSLCRGPSLRPRTLICNQTATYSPGLPFDRLYLRDAWIATRLPTPEGWKAELAWLAAPQRTVYPQSCHVSTIDQAFGSESPQAKDRRPNH